MNGSVAMLKAVIKLHEQLSGTMGLCLLAVLIT